MKWPKINKRVGPVSGDVQGRKFPKNNEIKNMRTYVFVYSGLWRFEIELMNAFVFWANSVLISMHVFSINKEKSQIAFLNFWWPLELYFCTDREWLHLSILPALSLSLSADAYNLIIACYFSNFYCKISRRWFMHLLFKKRVPPHPKLDSKKLREIYQQM